MKLLPLLGDDKHLLVHTQVLFVLFDGKAGRLKMFSEFSNGNLCGLQLLISSSQLFVRLAEPFM